MKKKVERHILKSRYCRNLFRFLSNVRIHNRRVSLFRILFIFQQKIKQDDVFGRAYGVAFNLTLSVFPATIFLVALLPYLPFIDHLQVMSFLKELMPPTVYEMADNTIKDILNRPRSGLLSFGVLLALYLATSGMISLMNAFNRIFKTRENRSFLKTRAMATFLTLMLAGMLLATVLMLVVGQFTLQWLYHQTSVLEDYQFYLLILLRFICMLTGFLVTISAIYYLAPSIHDRWQFFSPGSVLAALFCVAASFLFSSYINNFGTYNKIYGSIGALIALMIWLYMLSAIMLLGFTLNASIDTAFIRLGIKRQKPAPLLTTEKEADSLGKDIRS